MKAIARRSDCFFSIIKIVEQAYMMSLLVNLNASAPTVSVRIPEDAFDARFVCATQTSVHHVFAVIGCPKILPSVVRPIQVLVVNLIQRVFTSYEFPDYAMRSEQLPIDPDSDIPAAKSTGDHVCVNTFTPYLPTKDSGLFVV